MTKKNLISIPEWISSNSYFCDGEVCCYISNERTHEFFYFDGVAVEVWDFLLKNPNEEELLSFIKEKQIEEEFDEFINELEQLGLINQNVDSFHITNTGKNMSFEDEKECLKFLDERQTTLTRNGYLEKLIIELTYKCNLKCVHCYETPNSYQHKELSFEEVKPIIDEAKELGVLHIVLTGGESTIAKDVLKIASYVREKRISLEFYTNGQHLYDNRELLESIINLYPYRISLSLYSMNPEIHDKVTGVKGSFQKTLEIIKYLKSKNILVGIKCFLTSLNADSYPEVSSFVKENGLSMSLDCKFINNPVRYNKDIEVTEEQQYDIFSNDKSLLKTTGVLFETDTESLKNNIICRVGQYMLSIDPNLDVYCCPSLKIKLGNLKETSITEIWRPSTEQSVLSSIRKLRKIDLKECYTKEYCKYCIYCLGISNFAGKYLKKYEAFCKTAKIRMEVAKLNSEIDKNKLL